MLKNTDKVLNSGWHGTSSASWISQHHRHWIFCPFTMTVFCTGTNDSGLKTSTAVGKRVKRWCREPVKGADAKTIPGPPHPEPLPSRVSQEPHESMLGRSWGARLWQSWSLGVPAVGCFADLLGSLLMPMSEQSNVCLWCSFPHRNLYSDTV